MSDTSANRSHRAARRRAEREDRKQDQVTGVRSARGAREQAIEWVKAIAWALGVALLIRAFFFQAFRIPSESMRDTLLVHDYLFVNKLTFGPKTPDRLVVPFWNKVLLEGIPSVRLPGVRDPRQGDIIVFEFPRERVPEFPHNANQDFIKRCVAVAGDVVEVKDSVLYVNGKIYESNFAEYEGDHSCIPDWRDDSSCPEPHARRERGRMRDISRNSAFGPYTVPDDHLFMMGDNRFNSLDSRYWGPVHLDYVKGRAEIIYWSYESFFLFPRFDRLLKLIDLPPDRGWVQPVVRVGFVLLVIAVAVYYRRRDGKKEAVSEE